MQDAVTNFWHLVALLKSKQTNLGAALSIDLSSKGLSELEVIDILKTLLAGKPQFAAPSDFSLENKIDLVGAYRLARALKSGECPVGTTVLLPSREWFPEILEVLSDALELGRCPKGFTLVVSDHIGGDERNRTAIARLCDVMGSGKCPIDFNIKGGIPGLNLGSNVEKIIFQRLLALRENTSPQDIEKTFHMVRTATTMGLFDPPINQGEPQLKLLFSLYTKLHPDDDRLKPEFWSLRKTYAKSFTLFNQLGYKDTEYETWAVNPGPVPNIASIDLSDINIFESSFKDIVENIGKYKHSENLKLKLNETTQNNFLDAVKGAGIDPHSSLVELKSVYDQIQFIKHNCNYDVSLLKAYDPIVATLTALYFKAVLLDLRKKSPDDKQGFENVFEQIRQNDKELDYPESYIWEHILEEYPVYDDAHSRPTRAPTGTENMHTTLYNPTKNAKEEISEQKISSPKNK